MGKKHLARERSITGRFHDDTNYNVETIPRTELKDVLVKINNAISSNNHSELLGILTGDFYWNSYSYTVDNGYHRRVMYANDVLPVIEALFIYSPKHFLSIFNKVKDNDDLFNALVIALNETDLAILKDDWKPEIINKVNEGIQQLKTHATKLSSERALNEASDLFELTNKLERILNPKTTESTEEKSSSSLLSKSPDIKQRIEFTATLHSQDTAMKKHRHFWKVVVGNILLAVLGAGIFYGLAVWCKQGKPYFFANTDRQDKIDNVHKAIDPTRVLRGR